MTHFYNAKITKENDGQFSVSFPSLEGCLTWGDNLDEALFNSLEACELWLEGSLNDNLDIPASDRPQKHLHSIIPNNRLQIALEIKFSDKPISQIARDMNTSWAGVQRLLKQGSNPTLSQIDKLAKSLNKKAVLDWR